MNKNHHFKWVLMFYKAKSPVSFYTECIYLFIYCAILVIILHFMKPARWQPRTNSWSA